MADITKESSYNVSPSSLDHSKKATRSITFRLDSSVIDEMQREADQKEISLNVLVNQVLRRYSDWDRYENKIGMMPVPKQILSSLIEMTIDIARQSGIVKDDNDLEIYRNKVVKETAKIAFGLMKDAVLFMKKNYNLWTVLSVLQEYMKVSGINSDHRIESGRKHVFVIKHELGENWSVFTRELLALIFEQLANVRAEVKITPNTTTAEVIL
jgi:predicted HicB family RNase H-like nuclease